MAGQVIHGHKKGIYYHLPYYKFSNITNIQYTHTYYVFVGLSHDK